MLVILTKWNEFPALDLERIARKMAHLRMADLCNIYDAEKVIKAEFEAYDSVGCVSSPSARGNRAALFQPSFRM